MEIKNILVPTDFSEEANKALNYAVEVAKITGAAITLHHVIDTPVAQEAHGDGIGGFGGSGNDDETAIFKAYMDKLVEMTQAKFTELKGKYEGVTIKDHVVFDSMQKHISEFVTKDETDLIVIGSKGAQGIYELFVGSNTEKVIRLAKAPVMTVKLDSKQDVTFKDIVFASNFKDVSQKAVDALRTFQQAFGATVHFVKVITPNAFLSTPDTLKKIDDFAKQHGFDNYTANTINHYSEEEGIRAFAEKINADLISLITHGRTGFAHLILGSIAEEVANHAHMPVLTFNENFK